MSDKLVTIIIVTYNSEKIIQECLDSALADNYSFKKIVVIDNASNDRTVEVITNKYPQVHLIKNSKNLGFAGGNNKGIKFALDTFKSDYILLLNDDAVLTSNVLTQFVKTLEKDSAIGAAGCLITYDKDRSKVWFAGGYFNKRFCYTKHLYMDKNISDVCAIKNLGFITGCCLFLAKKTLEKVGLFDERYFMYFEDVDLCVRLKENGFKLKMVNDALVYHKVSTSAGIQGTNQLTGFKAYYMARNPLIFINDRAKGLLKATNVFGQLFIRAPYYVSDCILNRNFSAALHYLKGMLDGFKFL